MTPTAQAQSNSPESIVSALLSIAQNVTPIVGAPDGWIPESATMSYASANSITMVGDYSNRYQKGDKVRFVQTTTKYFYVLSVAYAAGNTTITFFVSTDYTVANAAISSVYYSHALNPMGFPHVMSYTPTWRAAGTQPAIGNGTMDGKFAVVGNEVMWAMKQLMGSTTTYGTGQYTYDLPCTPAAFHTTTLPTTGLSASGYAEDNGVAGYALNSSRYIATGKMTPQVNTGQIFGQTTPHTWGNADYWSADGKYLF